MKNHDQFHFAKAMLTLRWLIILFAQNLILFDLEWSLYTYQMLFLNYLLSTTSQIVWKLISILNVFRIYKRTFFVRFISVVKSTCLLCFVFLVHFTRDNPRIVKRKLIFGIYLLLILSTFSMFINVHAFSNMCLFSIFFIILH